MSTRKLVAPLTDREQEVDEDVCRVHSALAISGMAIYGVELLVGAVLWNVERDDPCNVVFQHFLLLRLLSYVYLIWNTWCDLLEFEPAHPGLHLVWTAIHTLTISALIVASDCRFRTGQSWFGVITAVVESLLMIGCCVVLRLERRHVQDLIDSGEITTIHPNTTRYLAFIPSADVARMDVTARQMLWESICTFDDVRDDVLVKEELLASPKLPPDIPAQSPSLKDRAEQTSNTPSKSDSTVANAPQESSSMAYFELSRVSRCNSLSL